MRFVARVCARVTCLVVDNWTLKLLAIRIQKSTIKRILGFSSPRKSEVRTPPFNGAYSIGQVRLLHIAYVFRKRLKERDGRMYGSRGGTGREEENG